MKKLLFTAISALAVVGVAQAAESTEFGVLRVPSDAKETIVSVPWLESSTDDKSVSVANLVLTADLANNDELRHYKGGAYECWHIETDSSGKHWVAGAVVTGDSKVSVTTAADSTCIPRGNAVFVIRQNPVVGKGFCIMGKPASGTATVTLTAGAYSLIAPTNVSGDTDVNTLTWTGLEKNKDYLYIPDPTTGKMSIYKYSPTSPAGWKDTTTGVVGGTIKAGTGAWFYTKGSTDRSVTL